MKRWDRAWRATPNLRGALSGDARRVEGETRRRAQFGQERGKTKQTLQIARFFSSPGFAHQTRYGLRLCKLKSSLGNLVRFKTCNLDLRNSLKRIPTSQVDRTGSFNDSELTARVFQLDFSKTNQPIGTLPTSKIPEHFEEVYFYLLARFVIQLMMIPRMRTGYVNVDRLETFLPSARVTHHQSQHEHSHALLLPRSARPFLGSHRALSPYLE